MHDAKIKVVARQHTANSYGTLQGEGSHHQHSLQGVIAAFGQLLQPRQQKLLVDNNMHQLQAQTHKSTFDKGACHQTA